MTRLTTGSGQPPDTYPHAALGRRTFLKGLAGIGAAATLPATLAACSDSDGADSGKTTGDPDAPARS
jgi:hypothetical protein